MVICIAPVFNLAVLADDVIEISSAEQFFAIEDNLGGNYKLTADITIKEGLSYREEGKLFTGTFDGDGHTITLDFVDTNGQRTGAFCSVDGCTIKNLKVDGRLVSTGNSTAALIGTVKNTGTVTIENVTTEVDIFANNSERSQGGIIGCLEDTPTVKLINCINNGDVMGECVGGLIGAVHGAATVEITGCTNNGNITNINKWHDYRGAGGFIGKVPSRDARVTIKNSTNNGDIEALYMTANAYVSHNNMNAGNYVVENCTNTGKVTSSGTVLTAELAVAKDAPTWGGGEIFFNSQTNILSGKPNFHSLPNTNGFKAYLNGVEATDKVTISVNDREITFAADFTGIGENDLARGVTFIWGDGTYSSYGTGAVAPKGGNNYIVTNGGCGFIDSNLYLENGFDEATELNDIKITLNGETAYWNKGYEGYRHCNLYGYDNTANAHIHVGIVGGDLIQGKNTLTLTCGDDVLTQYFTSTTNALGTSYAKVTSDASAHKTVAEIIFNKDPGFAIGTTFEGRVHDNHNTTSTFKVTDYNRFTGMYTIVGEGFVSTHTLLELKVTSEGQYKDYWVCATINAKNGAPKAGADVIAGSTIVPITNATSTFGEANLLIDSQKEDGTTGNKLQGNWPGSTVTVGLTAERALKLSYIVFFTDDDGSWGNRAPKHVKLYGSADNSSWTPLMEIQDAGIQNVSNTAFAVDVSASDAYQYYKLEILSNKGNGGYFQIEEILLLEGERIADNLAAGEPFNSADGTEYQSLAPEGNDDYKLYYQTRPGADGTTDYRIIAVVSKEYLEGEYTRINLTGTFTSSQDSKNFSADLTKAYALIEANAADGAKTVYATNDEYAIVGIVITGVQSGYALDVQSVDIGFSGNDGFIPV